MAKFHTFTVGNEPVLLHVAGNSPDRVIVESFASSIRVGPSAQSISGSSGANVTEDIANPSLVLGPSQQLWAARGVGIGTVLVTMQVFPLDEFGYDLSA